MPKLNTSAINFNLKCLFAILVLIYGCASMQAPQGGPIDKTPPAVLKMEPKNYTTNFTSKKVVITFDEYFNLQNEFKEFSISPEQEKAPLLKKVQKKLEITFQDSLEKNTTYTLNFGKMIADVNEGNAVKNLTYVFSTGPQLDSLSINGNVKNSLTGKPEIDAVVFILPLSRDSIFGKKKPSIYTTTDSSGNYSLNNLRKGTYKIYALKETNGDKIYQQNSDEIGFLKAPIELTKKVDSVNLQLFKEAAQSFRILDRKFNNDGSISMIFNQKLTKPEVIIIDNKTVNDSKLIRFNKTNDSLKIWPQDLSFDSIKVTIKNEGKGLDTVMFSRDKKDTYVRNIQNTDNLETGLLNPYRQFRITFNLPIEKIDLTKIKFTEDSIPRTTFTLLNDSTDLLSYTLVYPWRKKANYNIIFQEGAITSIFNVKNKEFRKIFKLGSIDDYGTNILKLEVEDPTKNYVLEILNDKKAVVLRDSFNKNKSLRLANYKTGTYTARIIYDDNKNGVWDTGNVSKGSQPEKIWYPPGDYGIRANFEVESKLIIPKNP